MMLTIKILNYENGKAEHLPSNKCTVCFYTIYITGFLKLVNIININFMLKTQQNHQQINGLISSSPKTYQTYKIKGLNSKQSQNINHNVFRDVGAETKKFKEQTNKKSKKISNNFEYYGQPTNQRSHTNLNIVRVDSIIKKQIEQKANPESQNSFSSKRMSNGMARKLFQTNSKNKQTYNRLNLLTRSSTKSGQSGEQRQSTPNRSKGKMIGLSNYMFTSQKNLRVWQQSRHRKIQQQYISGYKKLNKQLDQYKKLYNESVQKLKKSQKKREEENQKFRVEKKIYIEQIKTLKQKKSNTNTNIGHIYSYNDYEIQNMVPNSIIVEKKSQMQSQLNSLKQISQTQTVETSAILSINSNQQ